MLSQLLHPFITNKYVSMTTPTNLILLLEFCPGGDMFDQLYRHKKFSLRDGQIYIMQVLLPIEYMHRQGIVHRDLKLENILIAADGALASSPAAGAAHRARPGDARAAPLPPQARSS